MKTVNFYIAKRDRETHFDACLYYLNAANVSHKYRAHVFIGEDAEPALSILLRGHYAKKYPNLYLIPIVRKESGPFNKSILLNRCIECGENNNYAWFQIVDLDMLYPDYYFDRVEEQINRGLDYIVCHGWKLAKPTRPLVQDRMAFPDLLKTNLIDEFTVGPSQVAMTPRGYTLIKTHFSGPLYDERFRGWGGEDSVLSSKRQKLCQTGKLNSNDINQIWLHQWHEENKGNHPDYAQNLKLYQQIHADIMTRRLV